MRQVFTWVGRDRCSSGEGRRRLEAAGAQTRPGTTTWDRTTSWGSLKPPAYQGAAAFGKTAVDPVRPRLRAQRGRRLQRRCASSTRDKPGEAWMSSAVPALVDAVLGAAGAEQGQAHRQRARGSQRGARAVVPGVLLGAWCG